jgi:hypothetical protein|tara:strand:- start:26 stop:205 length:180 start_codon:yes stop_codon:yes gene_type:complete
MANFLRAGCKSPPVVMPYLNGYGQAHERSAKGCNPIVEDSRFGEIPEPTVIVRIKEKVS